MNLILYNCRNYRFEAQNKVAFYTYIWDLFIKYILIYFYDLNVI